MTEHEEDWFESSQEDVGLQCRTGQMAIAASSGKCACEPM
jgi:hypothetical protein